jgi:glutamate synthase (NADPH/NADH)
MTLQHLTASVPAEARIPAPLPGSRPVSTLLPAAASNGNGNGNGKTAASNIVAFTPASNSAAAALATELDAGVQSLLKPLKVRVCGTW